VVAALGIVLILGAATGAGCGSSDSGSSEAADYPWNQEFHGVEITEGDGGTPIPVPADLGLSSEEQKGEDWIGWSINCNLFGADLEVDGDRMRVDQVSSTAMGCPGEDEDEWLAEFLESGPEWRLQGEKLILTSGGDTVELAPGKVPSDG